ncbi:SA1362 family protein [Lederbergia ruris]|uniref:Membrane protein n=1 Tax=Lederbergia ruris TaxID=217495 RepID=A0ABQ4KCR6_9BACI|nr:SA1362 family protein [Lederbergia ruris]GIN55758.1 membrane protein [Lederbergia ruris]
MTIRNCLFGGIIISALIGLGTWLYYNPASLFLQLFFMVLIAGIILLVIRLFMGRKQGYKESRSFAKAAKLSKKRYQQPRKNVYVNTSAKRPLRKRSTAHLTVIEGKKNKKKDRAIF